MRASQRVLEERRLASKPAEAVPLTAEEAVAQAEVEWLKLETSSNAAGYKGVNVHAYRYQAVVTRAGKLVHLGYFDTAEQAALAVARATARTDVPTASPKRKRP